KVYIEYLHKDLEKAEEYKKEAKDFVKDYDEISLVESPEDADYAICFITPKSGNYFTATPGLLELSLCEDKTNVSMDGEKYQETTVSNIKRVEELSNIMRKNGKKLV